MQSVQNLNEQQRKAALHIEGPLLVLAGAGSGKTRIVTYRILTLLEMGVNPSEILAVTFTNKAAEEMKKRIRELSHRDVLTTTYHSLCARILRESIDHLGYQNNFLIYDDEDSEKLIREILKSLDEKVDKGIVKSLSQMISSAKNAFIEPSSCQEEGDPLFVKVYALYMEHLKSYNALDFDDLLYLTVTLFKTCPDVLQHYQKRWSFILIDEYQDTNESQYLITKMLSEKHQNLFAVGDPDQSIYSWRGANIKNILNFEKDFPGAQVVTLEQNYRSTNTILNAANALISHNEQRFEKRLWSDLKENEPIGLYISESERTEAEYVAKKILSLHQKETIPFQECVIFYRTNFQSRTFEDALIQEQVPYVIIGGLSFYQRREIKDLLSFFRLAVSPNDYLAFVRIVNLPKRGLGESALSKIKEVADALSLSILDACEKISEGKIPSVLSKKQTEALGDFVRIIGGIQEMIRQNLPLEEIVSLTIERSRILSHLKEDPATLDERKENLAELINKAHHWSLEAQDASIHSFLEELWLKSSQETSSASQDCVRLMTLHNGKGLEFKAVFLVGLEEDLFPHINSKDSPLAIEEERRLCYVGITRAKKHLFLTACRNRFLFGSTRMMRPSRFLNEIPKEFLKVQAGKSALPYENEGVQSGELPVGSSVKHLQFGVGVVQKSYSTSFGQTYDVYFPQEGVTRTLIAKYAKLILLTN